MQLPHLLPNFVSLSLLFCLLPKTAQYGDTSSDAIVVSYLHNAGIYWARDIMIVAICLNLLVQVAFVYLFNQPITEVGLVVTMLKPAADMIRVVSTCSFVCVAPLCTVRSL